MDLAPAIVGIVSVATIVAAILRQFSDQHFKDYNELKGDNKDLRKQNNDQEDRISALEATASSTGKELQETLANLKLALQKLEVETLARQQAERERDEALAKANKLQSTMTDMDDKLTRMRNDFDGLRDAFKRVEDEKEAALKLLDQKNAELSVRDGTIRDLKEEIRQLKERVTKVESRDTDKLPPVPDTPPDLPK